MMRVRGTVLGVTFIIATIGCGSTQNSKIIYGNARNQERIRYVLGASVSAKQVEDFQKMNENLIAEPWIGLSQKKEPLKTTSIRLYPTQRDARSYNYVYTFDLLMNGVAMRGKTQPVRGSNGELRGFISGPGLNPSPFCVADAVYAQVSPYGYVDNCLQDQSREYIGSQVLFSMATSEMGPLLHMTFRRPLNSVFGYQSTDLDFQAASQVKP